VGVTGELEGMVALVTGASSGIGAATARALATRGATVAVLARRADRLRSLAEEIRAAGGTVVVLVADVADHQQAESAVERAVADAGRLDILVNNAGLSHTGPVADASRDDWRRLLDVNVEGVLNVTTAALPHLVRAAADSVRGVSDLVTISSTAGRVARPGLALYSMTKFGVNAFSESLRQELLGSRVRVGIVEPGSVATEIVTLRGQGDSSSAATRAAGIEKLRPEDIADAVAYMVTRDRRVAVNEMLVRAAEQTW
jgi:NADP-dependent 3-hydroxy acid dehydrogenase YdfG